MELALLKDRTFTVAELAKFLKISKLKAYQMIWQNEIHSIRFGRNIRITADELIRFLANSTNRRWY